MACDCWERTNEALLEHNTRIVRPMHLKEVITEQGRRFDLAMTGVELATAKVDPKKRGKPVTFVATYCPMCGERYEEKAV